MKYTKKEIELFKKMYNQSAYGRLAPFISNRDVREFLTYDEDTLVDKILHLPLSQMPLYINHSNLVIIITVQWRLKIGK